MISDFFVYLNSDFARSRASSSSSRSGAASTGSGRSRTTYSVAKGKSSDPNAAKIVEESGGDATETRLSEGYLFWNRPAQADVQLRLPRRAATATGRRRSACRCRTASGSTSTAGPVGRAYTPQDAAGNATAEPYSKNGPFEAIFDVRFNQELRLGASSG